MRRSNSSLRITLSEEFRGTVYLFETAGGKPFSRVSPAVGFGVPCEVFQMLAVAVRPGGQQGRQNGVVPHNRGSEAHGLRILYSLCCHAHTFPPFALVASIFSVAFERISITGALRESRPVDRLMFKSLVQLFGHISYL